MNVIAESRYRDAILIAETTIKADEGCELNLYRCPAGKWTIGYGRNLEDCGITQDEAEFMFANDILAVVDRLRFFAFWSALNASRQAVLINLAYCVGIQGVKAFTRMIAALEDGNYSEAAAQILDSKFAQQTGGRANRLAAAMEQG